MKLRPYQVASVEAVEAQLSRVRATLLVMPTGAGKTVVFSEISRRANARGGRVLVLAHRSELLDQAAGKLRALGLTVGIEMAARTTIQERCDVVVASVQTLQNKRLRSFAPDAFALIIVDEAHHAAAKSYRNILDHFSGARILGVTATPDRADGIGLRGVFESVAFRLELKDGIEGGWLVPLDLRSVRVEDLDLSNVHCVAGDLHRGELEAELTRDAVLHEVAIPLSELIEDRQTIVFCAGVAQARALAEVLRAHGRTATSVDGTMPSEERATVLADYRSGRVQVVLNAMLWTEGFDAPETACVALVRPTRSRALLTQMIGRGLRPHENKASCLVLDFIANRASSMRLATPADVLAGDELPADVSDLIQEITARGRTELSLATAMAKQKAHEAKKSAEEIAAARKSETAELIQRVGLSYAITRLPLEKILEATAHESHNPEFSGIASMGEVQALRDAGLNVPANISRRDAVRLLEAIAMRKRQGLSTLKQAKRLESYGLRGDIPFAHACIALDVISAHGWKPPSWLYRDKRFARAGAA